MKWVESFLIYACLISALVSGQVEGGQDARILDKNRDKRQVSLDDLIHGALQLVKPIFDTSEPISNPDSPMIPSKTAVDDTPVFEGRQSAALGVDEENSNKEAAPICRGNSKICKFIACSASNFKHDQSFSNLNLAAQLISDPKLRKTITNNPESVVSVCKEQGLSETECKLFAQGFQVIDRFITVVEPKEDTVASESADPVIRKEKLTEAAVFTEPMMDAPARIPKTVRPIGRMSGSNPSIMGSRTWSTHGNVVLRSSGNVVKPIVPEVVINHRTTDERKPFSNAVFSTRPIHVPTATAPKSTTSTARHVSTVNTPIQPVIQRPIAKVPTKHDGMSFSVDEENLVLSRPRRGSFQNPLDSDFEDFESIDVLSRGKRAPEYYEQVESSGQDRTTMTGGGGGSDTDYYESVGEGQSSGSSSGSPRPGGGLAGKIGGFIPSNCFHLLG